MSAAGLKSLERRGPREAWSFLRSAIATTVRGGPAPAAETGDSLDRRLPIHRPDRPLGVEIAALGPRSRAVFAATSRVASEWSAATDVVAADRRAEAGEVDCPVVALPEAPPRLRVPAFDPTVDNPVGWRRGAGDQVGALGPPEQLPSGVTADRILSAHPDRTALRELRHVEDVAAWHADPIARAGELARLAANGVVVHLADGGPGLEPLLGEELHALMAGEAPDPDPDAREWLSIRMRRLAHRDHSLRARARQFAEEALSDPPRHPRVSILLPTRRPGFLPHALASVARQNWPELELVLALHGDGFDAGEVEQRVRELPCPTTVVRMDGGCPLGTLLGEATEHASGWLLTKMDDDDLYDADHIRDLVLAYEYSEAEVVGRVTQFFWLGNVDRTVHLWPDSGERYSTGALVSGGAMLFSRRAYDAAGGWQRVSGEEGEDMRLLGDAQWQGESIYQTHGTGYVVVRHSTDHAWEEAESRLEGMAVAARAGWAPELARMDRRIAPPPVARNGAAPESRSAPRRRAGAPGSSSGDRDEAGFEKVEPALGGPEYVVTLEAAYVPAARVAAVVERLLAEDGLDLAIRIETRAEGAEAQALRDRLPPDPRVRIVASDASDDPARASGRRDPRLGVFLEKALDEFPDTPFHLLLPARVDLRPDLIARLRVHLGEGAAASCDLPGGMSVAIARGAALHRARRADASVVDFGARRPIFSHCLFTPPPASLSGEEPSASDPGAGRPLHRRLRRRAADRVRRAVGRKEERRSGDGPSGALVAPSRRPDDALGVEIAALGPRSRAVFGATARVAHELRAGVHVDVVVADTPEEAAGAGAPAVVLAQAPAHLQVPAFDPRVDNPVNWRYQVGEEVGALGPIEWLPRGGEAHRALPRRPDKAALRDLHHVEDVAAYHADAPARAGELARLAANGAVVHLADGGPGLEPLLGEELHALMTTEVRELDLGAREWLSIRMRRLALREHSRRARARQIAETTLSDPPREPLVSVLTGTYRPEFLAHGLASMARQTWPRLELILALHGDGFDPGEVEQRVRELKCPVKVVRVDRSHGLGGVLHRATQASSGPILTLIDDDDLYDAEHIRDLMLAYEYSGAALVGKLAQCVWLRRSGRTVRLWNAGGERYLPYPGGPTLTLSRQTLEEAGGWNRHRPDVDRALIEKIESIGGRIYQSHGAGFTLVRHGIDHAWNAPDSGLLSRAETVSDGWDPALAHLVQDIPLPIPARAALNAPRVENARAGQAGATTPFTPGGRSSRLMQPPMSCVPYNDWRQVEIADPEAFTPVHPVSVIICCYQAPEELALTLACLERQTYPRDLFEVIVVDDGSNPPLNIPPSTPLDVRMVYQEDRGFGLARARNHGARAARHDILVFLDCDVLAEAELIAAHARWHHTIGDALTLGFRNHVEMEGLDAARLRNRPGSLEELFSDRATEPTWSEPVMLRTNDLTTRSDHLFWGITGANFALRRQFWELVGGMDESFTRYGGEDTEFAWRVQARGGLLVPTRDAMTWHQGLWAEDRRDDKQDNVRFQRSKMAHLVPVPHFRGERGGRSFTIPKCVVTLEAERMTSDWILDITGRLLADREHDLVVRVETRATGDEFEWLHNHLGEEPRVRFSHPGAALDEFPVTRFHIAITDKVLFRAGLVHRLCRLLGTAVRAECPVPGGGEVSITRCWALHRAHRTGKEIAFFGDVARLPARKLPLLPTTAMRWPLGTPPSRVYNVWMEFKEIRNFTGAWLFAKWVVGALARRMKVRSRG